MLSQDKVNDIELYYECMSVYDNNQEALILHIHTLLLRHNNNTLKSTITKNFTDLKQLKKYKTMFIKVLDSFKSEIEEYKLKTKFFITGTHTDLLYIFDNLEDLDKIDIEKKSKLEKELVKILYYTEQILEKINDAKQK